MDFDPLKKFEDALKQVSGKVNSLSPPATPPSPPGNNPQQPPTAAPPHAPPQYPLNDPLKSIASRLNTGFATGGMPIDDIPVRVSRDEAILNPKQIDMLGRGRVMDVLSNTGAKAIDAGRGYATGGSPGPGIPWEKIIEQIQKGIASRIKNTLDTGKNFGDAITSQRVGSMVGSASKTVGSSAKAVLGEHDPFARIIDGIAKLNEVIFKATDHLRDWSKQLHDSNIKFAQYSGPMAAVDIRQQVRDINLSKERGARRAESAEVLAQGKHRLEREFAPIEDAIANLQNYITGFIDNTLADVLVIIKEAAKKYLNIDLTATDTSYDPKAELEKLANSDPRFDSQGRPKGRF